MDKIIIVNPLFGEKHFLAVGPSYYFYPTYKIMIECKAVMHGAPIAEYLTPETAKKYNITGVEYDGSTDNSQDKVGHGNKGNSLRLVRR